MLFPGLARSIRLEGLGQGDIPKDFFYGYPHLIEAGYKVQLIDTRKDPDSMMGKCMLWSQYYASRLLGLGFNTERVAAVENDLRQADLAVSFTDAFSLSMGFRKTRDSSMPMLIGGFHGLSDLEEFAKPIFRPLVRRIIRKSLSGLDHIFFFGPGDRGRACEMYELDASKTSLFEFGIDLDFWCPANAPYIPDGILAVGSDSKRDYETLIKAPTTENIHIVTRLNLERYQKRTNVKILKGSWEGSKITDLVLRDMYRKSLAVVVPLLNVWQPSGYSVTLQAMACGKPVVLSDIKGLWDRDVFQSGVNCILVRPGDPQAVGQAVSKLRHDEKLRVSMGIAARETAVKMFGIKRMENALQKLVDANAENF
jgi:glycosyltransferase involved in cell wall biosynthesis